MIKTIAASVAAGAALLLAVTAQTMAPMSGGAMMSAGEKAPMQIRLTAENNSGETGTATLLNGAKGLIVKVRMSGAGTDVDQPAHIHKGTCDKLDPKPTYPLKTLHDGTSETTIEGVTIAQLEKSPFAINVHKSTKEIPVYVACGNIVAPK